MADLIDWLGVARNALWILGLSIALAAWSYVVWWARMSHCGLRRALARAAFQTPFNIGLLLFSVSLAWGSTRLWERLAWIALSVAFAWQVIVAVRPNRANVETSSQEETR